MAESDTPQPPRPGSQGSNPPGSDHVLELPYAEELQAMLEGRYIVENFLGQGGMGAVYRGLQMPLKRPVAIKILQKRQGESEHDYAFEERFKREAYAMASLTHPNIVQVYDCGDAGENFLFISMELVEGGDLSDAIKQKQVTPELALKYIVQICDGLEAAHERGLVHRDIKPANIFLTGNGRAKVADFGLAKQFDAKNTMLTKTGLGMGTPDYAAPEQYDGAADLDHRADIYALGVMFYQMLTGRLPRGVYKPASKRVAVDARLDGVIDKAMEADRTHRYQSVADMKADIEQIVATWMEAAQQPETLANTGAVPSHTSAVPGNTSRVPLPQRPTSHRPMRTAAVSPSQATPEAELPEKKKGRAGMVAGIVLGAAAAIAVGVFMVLKKREPVPDTPGTTAALSSSPKDAANASASLPREATTSPSVASPPTAAAARFSSFASGAKWRDGFATSEKWDDHWQRVGTEMQIVGQSNGSFVFSDMTVNAGIRARFRSQRQGAFFELVQRYIRFGPAPRYVATMRTNEKLSGALDIVPPPDQGPRHRLAPFTGSPAMGTGVEHTAELYAIGDQVTFFFDGQQLASVRDGTLADGYAGLLAAPGTEIISLEMATLEASAFGPGRPIGEALTFGGHRYQHFSDAVGWPAAKVRAEAAGGHLATITSKEENDWIVENFISKLPQGGPGVWFGGESQGTKGQWRWVTKEPFEFTGWALGEPQNVDHEYALMFMNKAPGGPGWTDMNPVGITSQDRRGGLIVEWDQASAPVAMPSSKAASSGGTGNLVEGSAMPPAPAPAPAAAKIAVPPPQADPRLEQLAGGFKARYESEAEKPYLEGAAALDQSYLNNGIGRAKSAAQQKGLLDELASLDAERTRVQNHEPLPATDLESLPASLKQLRTTYRASLAKLEAERAKKGARLYDLYLAALDSYVAELTKADKIEQARKVQALRDEVAARKVALGGDSVAASAVEGSASPAVPQPPSGNAPTTGPAGSSSPVPPEVLAPPQKGKQTRQLIEWVMKRKSFRIGYSQGNNRLQVSNTDRRAIPNSADPWLIDIGNQDQADGFDPAWLEGQTDLEELHLHLLPEFKTPLVLRGMKKLLFLRITGNPKMLDDEAMRLFPPMPSLMSLDLQGSFGNVGLRTICERCPKLDTIALNQRFTEGGLSPLSRLKGLKRAVFNYGEVHGPDIQTLGALPSLEYLQFSGGCKIVGPYDLSKLAGVLDLTMDTMDLADGDVKPLTVLKKLTGLNLSGNSRITDDAIAQLASLTRLSQLRMRGCALKNLGGADMPVFPKLELCHMHGNAALDDAACAGLAKQKTLKSIYVGDSSVADPGLQVLCDNLRNVTELNISNTRVTDAGMTALRRLEKLEKLWLDGNAITDASVDALRKLSALTELHVARTQLSATAIATLEKALSRCKVYSE